MTDNTAVIYPQFIALTMKVEASCKSQASIKTFHRDSHHDSHHDKSREKSPHQSKGKDGCRGHSNNKRADSSSASASINKTPVPYPLS